MIKTLTALSLIASLLVAPGAATTENLDNHLDNEFILLTENDVLLKVPFVHQLDDLKNTQYEYAGPSACGPATIAMLLKYHGKTYDLSTVVDRLPSNVYVKGSMFYDLAKGPNEFGYISQELDIDMTQIYKTLASGEPVILNIQNYDGIVGHAVVVVGIRGYNGVSAQSLTVHDPHKGPYREFKVVNNYVLQQPEGFYNPIGVINPFYIQSAANALKI